MYRFENGRKGNKDINYFVVHNYKCYENTMPMHVTKRAIVEFFLGVS